MTIWMKLAAVAAILAALAGYHHYVFEQGVAQESARRDKIEQAANAKAAADLEAKNKEVAAAQQEIDNVKQQLASREQELNDAKTQSDILRTQLADGARRLSVLVTARKNDGTEHAQSAASTDVDHGATFTADLTPGVAADLERLRADKNAAIDRLDGCISQYNAVKDAADKLLSARE